jgi:hypothetical protein
MPISEKNNILNMVDQNPGLSRRDIGYSMGLSWSGASGQIGRWLTLRATNVEQWGKDKSPNCKKTAVESEPKFLEAENELHDRFLFRRRKKSLFVDNRWLRKEMKKILVVLRPEGYMDFGYSNGWLHRFCIRWRISGQAKTDSKSETTEFRTAKLKAVMHKYLHIQNELEQLDSIYGHFKPSQHWHVDQVPMPFSYPRNRSLNKIGEQCKIIGVSPGLAKRQCTIHLTIRAWGEQIVPPVIIFKGRGAQVEPSEVAFYNSIGIKVYFQKKAWCDTTFMEWYILNVFNPSVRASGDLGEQLLMLDNLNSHYAQRSIDAMKECNIYPFFLAKNCTDVGAPVDHHVGALLKVYIKSCYEKNLEKPGQYELWRGQGDPDVPVYLTAGRRRRLMASWLDEAWISLKSRSSLFLHAFTSTGCLMQKDGTNLVKMRGIPGLD